MHAHDRQHDRQQELTLHHQRHDHPHDDHGPDGHHHGDNLWGIVARALHLPGHGHTHDRPATPDALYTNELGVRTVQWALAALGATTLLQVIIYLASGSVALLADTVHNLGDALNSVPLWLAFVLARRAANKRYTYGYGRAEDIAGLLIVVSIAFSAGYILWESVQKFLHPQPLSNLGWVAAASLVGFLGNELVALLQINVGRRIGSEAMVTDGRHARADGLTSLSVLLAVGGSWLGFPILDPIVGLLIGIAILFITRDAMVAMWYRLMDAVDPQLVETAESVLTQHAAVRDVANLRLRWVGHQLQLEASICVDQALTVGEVGVVTGALSEELRRALPHLVSVTLAPVACPADAE